MVDEKLLKAAYKAVKALDQQADNLLPEKIVSIVKLHSKLAVGSAFIPLPGADIAACAASIWGMYIRINEKMGIPFKENLMKSIGSGIATNLASGMAMTGVASLMKFIPGLGTLGGGAIMAVSMYALTLASGYIYLTALGKVTGKDVNSISEEDLKGSISAVMSDKSEIKQFISEAKKSYKPENN